MTHYFRLNTFTGDGLKGNPTPVYLIENELEHEKMELLAKDFPSTVSVFVKKQSLEDQYLIRYFTTTGEIPVCGHGTLGAAYILLNKYLDFDSVCFQTIENMLLVASKETGGCFVRYPKLTKSDIAPDHGINEALGIKNFKSYFLCKELESLFIELESDEEVRNLSPNYQQLKVSTTLIKEVVVMSESQSRDYDFTLRSFCPWIGINEDPVTGSIHSVLGHFWQDRLGKTVLKVMQSSPKGGEIIVKPELDFVKIGGDCEILEEKTLED